MADLAEAVVSREHGTSTTDISNESVEAVESTLYHSHVPKLADAGVVEYDRERTLVRLSEDTEQLERHLSLTPSEG